MNECNILNDRVTHFSVAPMLLNYKIAMNFWDAEPFVRDVLLCVQCLGAHKNVLKRGLKSRIMETVYAIQTNTALVKMSQLSGIKRRSRQSKTVFYVSSFRRRASQCTPLNELEIVLGKLNRASHNYKLQPPCSVLHSQLDVGPLQSGSHCYSQQ